MFIPNVSMEVITGESICDYVGLKEINVSFQDFILELQNDCAAHNSEKANVYF